MSWDVSLADADGNCYGDFNYTHNCNAMIEAALDRLSLPKALSVDSTHKPFWSTFPTAAAGMGRASWWDLLNGLDGPAGGELLSSIVRELEADPERFRAMNPPNGWGDYETLVMKLTAMASAVPVDVKTVWSANG